MSFNRQPLDDAEIDEINNDDEPGPSVFTQFAVVLGLLAFCLLLAFTEDLRDQGRWVFWGTALAFAILIGFGHLLRTAFRRHHD